MKTLRILSAITVMLALSGISYGQEAKTESFKVLGNCGMCKSKIEKAAKDAGATTATWDVESKQLTVKYNSASTNTAKIQQKIAGVGYDNVGFKSTDEVYNKLHGCCKYDRTASTEKAGCCSADVCKMKDGKFVDMEACKDKGCCNSDGVCKMANHKHEAGKMDCCKDGKCSKEGHDGKNCCKSSD